MATITVPPAPASSDPGPRLAYLIPGPMDRTELGLAEVERRAAKLHSWAAAGTEISVRTTVAGPATIESIYEEYLATPPLAELAFDVAAEGFDAAVIGCFGDPGMDGLREVHDMLVVGPASASIALATTLGHKFSVVTVTESIVHALRRLVWEAGCNDALASVRFVELSVFEINQEPESAYGRMLTEGRRAVAEDGADTLILGCMSMGFLDVAERLTRELGVPVVNPVKAGLKLAEATVSMGLSHSKKAFITPPKLAGGKQVSDLLVATGSSVAAR